MLKMMVGWVRSDEGDELALGIAIADDVTLRGGDGLMSGQLLYVAQRSARSGKYARRSGNERAASRVRGAAMQAELAVCVAEPVHDAARRHVALPL